MFIVPKFTEKLQQQIAGLVLVMENLESRGILFHFPGLENQYTFYE